MANMHMAMYSEDEDWTESRRAAIDSPFSSFRSSLSWTPAAPPSKFTPRICPTNPSDTGGSLDELQDHHRRTSSQEARPRLKASGGSATSQRITRHPGKKQVEISPRESVKREFSSADDE